MKYQTTRKDVYQTVTDKIVTALESGTRPWCQPWDAAHQDGPISRPLRANKEPYHGINVLTLWLDAQSKGYTAPIWMTYKQAQEQKAFVKRGEHGSQVVYASTFSKTQTNDKGEDETVNVPFLKSYTVFNVEQIEGLGPEFYAAAREPRTDAERYAHADAFVANTGASITETGNRAFYRPATDSICMPPIATFDNSEAFYATELHELTHWTKAKHRLDRDFGQKRFGDNSYAQEELVAELGAAFLCADLAISNEPRADHASYLASWLQVLKNDKRAIFTAASHASKAADYLHALQETESVANAA